MWYVPIPLWAVGIHALGQNSKSISPTTAASIRNLTTRMTQTSRYTLPFPETAITITVSHNPTTNSTRYRPVYRHFTFQVYASEYEVVCPNTILGCDHSCSRSSLAQHLDTCRFSGTPSFIISHQSANQRRVGVSFSLSIAKDTLLSWKESVVWF